jgi:hypothetical protein
LFDMYFELIPHCFKAVYDRLLRDRAFAVWREVTCAY